jgi:hypothetical protein
MGCGRKGLGTAISTKDNIYKIKSTVMVFSHGLVETSIKETIVKILEVVLDRCTGMMEAFTKGNGLMEYSMGKDLFLHSDKARKKDYLKIILWSRFTNSSPPPIIKYVQERYTKICLVS